LHWWPARYLSGRSRAAIPSSAVRDSFRFPAGGPRLFLPAHPAMTLAAEKIVILEGLHRDGSLIEDHIALEQPIEFLRCRTREELEAALDSFRPDVLVSAFRFPSFDGLAVLRILRKRGLQTPVIFVDQPIGEETVVRAFREGAFDFVLRDRLSTLSAEVSRAIASSRSRSHRALDTAYLRGDQLLATVSHEIENVLTGIGAFTDIIYRSSNEDSILRPIEQIKRSLKRGRSITDQILRSSLPATPILRSVDLVRWIANLEPELRVMLDEGIELDIRTPDSPCLALVDVHQLEQVLTNLVGNAGDSISKSGKVSIDLRGTVSPSLAAAHSLDTAAAYTSLTVADDGSGIPEDALAHIFEPLYTTKSRGTGLGLPLVAQIVAAHGGFISVESAEASGTCFRILLPKARSISTRTSHGPVIVRHREWPA